MRTDGSDLIFGGSGVAIARNAIGDATLTTGTDSNGNAITNVITTNPNGHANDSDAIVGDNGDILRLVGINGQVAAPVGNLTLTGNLGQAGMPVQSFNGFLRFNYDNYNDAAGAVKIVVRAVRQLDYTPGGPDFNAAGTAKDVGAADELHGESGDDFMYAGKGSDWMYGEGQSDDMIGGYGNDWMSGGTGDDGLIGDDGRIYTSRNSLSSVSGATGYLISQGEPLNGIASLLQSDADPKYSNGNALNEFIFTPGNMQTDTINVSGALKKTVDLTPFSVDPNWDGQAQPAVDEFAYLSAKPNQPGSDGKTTKHYDDILFGGLGSDWVHGGSGDDAMSGAEALKVSYTQVEDPTSGDLTGIAETDYAHPFDPGDALRFNPTDPDGKFTHPHIAGRTGEFALYDENDPLRIVLLNGDGTLDKNAADMPVNGVVPATAKQFFLNFDQTEGVHHAGGTAQQNGNQTVTYGAVSDDGNDVVFGDNGNDWIVGGTGRDHTYGGWGNDLLNANDDLTTAGGLSNVPVTAPTYEDRAYGGAGKDVLIANTGGDRLIDWVGEYNSYLVPFSEFGMATVSRTMQPFLHHFLYADSLSDGVDATRYSDLNGGAASPAAKNNDPNPGRNGEPAGELGLVLQQDSAWHGQTGAPTDPQAGNTSGTQRDVLRTANFSGNGPSAMFVDSGTWSISGASYQNSLATVKGDNVSLFDLNTWLPTFYEVQTSTKVQSGGSLQNSFVIFDYQGPGNFKYAGLDIKNGQLTIGQRSATGWTDLATLKVKGLGLNAVNTFLVQANGAVATVNYGNFSLSYTFAGPLNTGLLGLGTNNSLAQFTAYTVQRLPIAYTYSVLQDFSGTVANPFTPQSGSWTATTGTTGRYAASAPANGVALATRGLAVAPLSYVEYSATVNAGASGATAGLAFGVTSANDFLFAGIVAGSNQVVLGHRSNGVWTIDATANVTINAGTDYTLLVALVEGTTNTVNVILNGKSVTSYNYNYLVHDGGVGLFARNGNASFDNVLLRGDDIAYAGGGAPLMAATAALQAGTNSSTLDASAVGAALAEAERRWVASGLVSAQAVTALGAIQIQIADLQGLALGLTNESQHEIVIDGNAAGHGWFIDPTLARDEEFVQRSGADEAAATFGSQAYGRIDLLTVVEHEVGHLLGFEHGSMDLMDATLATGLRITPDAVPNLADGSALVPGLDVGDGAAGAALGALAGVDAEAPPKVVIDWSLGSAGTKPTRVAAPAAGHAEWTNRFVNHLGADASRINPNAKIQLTVPLQPRVEIL